MPVTLSIVESTTELNTVVTEVILESASTPGPPGVGVPAGGTTGQSLVKASDTDYDTEWDDVAGGGGAPTDVDYLVGTASGSLSAEIVVGTSPGGELGGTWASPTVDATHSGSSHAAVQAAAEATAAAALSAHVTDTSDAHDASAISVDSTTLSGTGTDVQASLEEIDNLLDDHSARHENGGADEISLAGLSGVPADVPPSTRSLTAGNGLSGGGDLSADRSFAVNVDDSSIEISTDTLRVKAGGITAAMVAADVATQAELDAHTGDTSDAHDASAISVDSTTLVGTGTDVQAVLEELDNGIADHLADASAAHAASAISVADAGGFYVGTTVESVLQEILDGVFTQDTYTPVLTASSVNPTMGSGSSAFGRYMRIGNFVVVWGQVVFGTSGVAAGTGDYRISLPVTAVLDVTPRVGMVILNDNSSGAAFSLGAAVIVNGQETYFYMQRHGSSSFIGAGVPWTWAASDDIAFVIAYPAG